MSFLQKLQGAWETNNSLLCVGLDPDLDRLPEQLRKSRYPVFDFNRAIIDATGPFACAFKPQIAYYSGQNLLDELEMTLSYLRESQPDIPIILDAKRGDIGTTATMYAKAAFEHYCVDAVTVNPYMGGDTLEPFLSYQDKGVIVLCRTSNPGSGDFQELRVEGSGKRIFEIVAEKAANSWNGAGNVALVVGATYPEDLSTVRAIVGDMPLLVPGIGAQGGDVEAAVRNGANSAGTGLIINSSRGIIYAGSDEDFAAAAGQAAQVLRNEINRYR